MRIIPKSSIKPKLFYGYVVVFALLVVMTVLWATRFAFGIFFQPVLNEFGWTRAMVSGAFSLSIIIEGFVSILMGGLNDRLGPRLVVTGTGVLLGIGYVLMGHISSFWQFYLYYGVLIGIGMSGSFVPAVTTVARWFVTRRSTMTGIVLAGTGIGNLIGAPAAEWLVSTFSWRNSYIIMGITVSVICIIAAQFLKRDPAGIGQVAYGEGNDNAAGANPGSGGFTLRQAMRTGQFWLFFFMLFFFGISLFTIMVHIVPYATGLGISAPVAASILAAFGGSSILGRLILGSVADRVGNKQIFIIGFAFATAALFWLVFAEKAWMLYLFSAVFGFAQGGMGASQPPMVARLFGLSSLGVILGVVGLGLTVGAAVGPLLAGYIYDVTTSYRLAFLLAAVSCIAALILSIPLTPVNNKAQHEG